jgi:hypothetical protein
MELTTPHPHALGRSDSLSGLLRRPPALRRRLVSAAVVAATLGLGVYAGTNVDRSGEAGGIAGASTNAPLSARVLAPHSLPGFSLNADTAPVFSAYEWALVERVRTPASETARLRSLGFVGGFDEQLHARYPSQAAAVSVVERYRTPSAARTELSHQYAQIRSQAGKDVSTFPVPAIPGARGIQVQAGGRVDMTVLFTSGQYSYAIRTATLVHSHGVLTQAELTRAAGTEYLSVNDCVATQAPAA